MRGASDHVPADLVVASPAGGWAGRLLGWTLLSGLLGYLAVRRLELPAEVRSRRAAVLGIVSFLNVIIVHYSVQWWRDLHQGQTS